MYLKWLLLLGCYV